MIYFTPGPTKLHKSVPKYINLALKNKLLSKSHRGSDFHIMYEETEHELRKLLNIPQSHLLFFISSATEAMERIIQNTVYEKSEHFINGAFSEKFFKIALNLGKKAVPHSVEFGNFITPVSFAGPKRSETACFTHNETSSGVSLDLQELYKYKNKYPDKLIALDIVSSVPYVEVNFSNLDCIFFSIQKGFGLPSGLGVLVISPRAFEKSLYIEKKGKSVGSYHKFSELKRYSDRKETPETPNILALFLLGKISKELNKIGLKKIRKEIDQKADSLYNILPKTKLFSPFIKDIKHRSKTVIVIETAVNSKNIIDTLKSAGIMIGSGYKEYKEKHLRIANFPQHSLNDYKKLAKYLIEISHS